MTELSLRLPITPVPKARARTVASHGGVRTFTPDATVRFEGLVRAHVFTQLGTGLRKLEGPLEVTVIAYCASPKRSVAGWEGIPTGDVDNYAKAVLDACNGLLWRDDRQITSLIAAKRPCADGEKPHVYLAIRQDARLGVIPTEAA